MNINNIFKILIVFIILIISIGSIYASQDADLDSSNNIDYEDDIEFEDNLNEDNDFSDEDFDDDSDDEDFDDDSDDEIYDDDWDLNESDFSEDINSTISDFEFLEFKITIYLQKYGNLSDENWTSSDDFISNYQLYLIDSANYILNESASGYETYLKIFDSITSTFDDYNLTENETKYLKFMIIYFLNNYGNVSENYTWNESDDFSNYFPIAYLVSSGFENGFASDNLKSYVNNIFYNSSIHNYNSTSFENATNVELHPKDMFWLDIIAVFLLLLFMILILKI